MNSTQENTIQEKAEQVLSAKRPRATWANETAIEYLWQAKESQAHGYRPYSIGSWFSGRIGGSAAAYEARYYRSFVKSLFILEAAGLVERIPSRGGATAYRWKGE